MQSISHFSVHCFWVVFNLLPYTGVMWLQGLRSNGKILPNSEFVCITLLLRIKRIILVRDIIVFNYTPMHCHPCCYYCCGHHCCCDSAADPWPIIHGASSSHYIFPQFLAALMIDCYVWCIIEPWKKLLTELFITVTSIKPSFYCCLIAQPRYDNDSLLCVVHQ